MSTPTGLEGPRDFVYIEPAGRRLSEYEALNLFTQPTEANETHPVAKRTGWSESSTALRSSNWYSFRDPAAMWYRPYIRRQTEQERAIARTMTAAVASGSVNRITDDWAWLLLGDFYVPCAFFEHGLFRALSHASVVALSDVLSVALIFNAVDKERHAEDILHHQYDLCGAGVAVGDSDRRARWLSDPLLQPMRRLIELLCACADWCEVAVAINLVIEPLLCRFIYNEIIGAQAWAHGDVVTPIVVAEAENDRQRNIEWSIALVRMLVGDDLYGDANRTLIDGWIAAWAAEVTPVLESLSSVAECAGARYSDAVTSIQVEWRQLIDRSGLTPVAPLGQGLAVAGGGA